MKESEGPQGEFFQAEGLENLLHQGSHYSGAQKRNQMADIKSGFSLVGGSY